MVFSFLYQISYLNLACILICRHTERKEILRDVILTPKEPQEVFSLLEIMELLIKVTNENCWLSACFQLILKTNFVDKGRGDNNIARSIRHMFYHYNYQGDKDDDKRDKYPTFISFFSECYQMALKGVGEKPDFRVLKWIWIM